MATKDKLRSSILNKIKKLSDDKLSNLNTYIDDLEFHFSSQQSSLSFSGIFKDLELDDLTSGLHVNRQDNNERIPQF